MLDGLKPYPAYKDSGVPWLGKVPEHWDVARGKAVFRESMLPVRDSDEIVTCFRDGQVTLRRNRRSSGFMVALKEIGYQGVRRGQLVIHAMDAFAGAVGVSDSDGKCTPEYIVCDPRSSDSLPAYFSAALRVAAQQRYIEVACPAVRERAPRLRFPDFGTMLFARPPRDEQSAIVRLLAYANRIVRSYVGAKRKTGALLEEQRMALIESAVSLGLDRGHAIKSSGFDWLPSIPMHWRVSPLRQCVHIVGGMTPSTADRSLWGGDIPWVTPKDMKRFRIRESIDHVSQAALERTSLSVVPPRAVLFVVRGMILARRVPIAVTDVPVTVNQDMKALLPSAYLDPEFLALTLLAAREALAVLIDDAGHGTKRLPMERWRDLPIPLPPLPEQVQIARNVAQATALIDEAVECIARETSLAREALVRLTADVVSGKLDVRRAADGLQDEMAEFEGVDPGQDGEEEGIGETDDETLSTEEADA